MRPQSFGSAECMSGRTASIPRRRGLVARLGTLGLAVILECALMMPAGSGRREVYPIRCGTGETVCPSCHAVNQVRVARSAGGLMRAGLNVLLWLTLGVPFVRQLWQCKVCGARFFRQSVIRQRVCSGCGYALNGLTEPRCPECGRRFDPNPPSSRTLKCGCHGAAHSRGRRSPEQAVSPEKAP